MNYTIAKMNGEQVIKDKIIEECKELIQAIETNDELNIIEEIGDVMNVTEQYLIVKNMRYECVQMRLEKQERTLGRMVINKK